MKLPSMEQKNYCKGCGNLIQYTTNKDYCIFCKSEEFSKKISRKLVVYCRFKILLFGDNKVGRSTLLKDLLSFHESIINIVGVNTCVKEIIIKERMFYLSIWKLSNENRFKSFLSSYIQGSNGVLLIYDITRAETLNILSKWHNIIRDYTTTHNFPILLIGNKLDLEEYRQVSKEQVEKFKEAH